MNETLKKLIEKMKSMSNMNINASFKEFKIAMETKDNDVIFSFDDKVNNLHYSYRGDIIGLEKYFDKFILKNYDVKQKPKYLDENFIENLKFTMMGKLISIYTPSICNKLELNPTPGFITDMAWSLAHAMEEVCNYKGHIKDNGTAYFIDKLGKTVECRSISMWKLVPLYRNWEDAKIAMMILRPYLEKVYGKQEDK